MKSFTLLLLAAIMVGCGTPHQANFGMYTQGTGGYEATDPLITQSLFSDKASTITEENIQKILDGDYKLPAKLRVAIVKLETPQKQNAFYWNDEEYIRNQQAYIQTLTEQLTRSPRVAKVTLVPELMIGKPLSITNLREAGVRMQADVMIIFTSIGDLYSKYKFFSKADIKAFATTQVVVLDTRTALVPFTYITTKDVLSQKSAADLDYSEARKRIQNEAVKLTISDVGDKLVAFLK
jgi:hypothetical protein